jgi:hypothetical protein
LFQITPAPPRRRTGYKQLCTLAVFEEVVSLLEERGHEGVTTNELWAGLPDQPCTQISIALAFLKERGCVETIGRRSYVASATLHEDALAEFHYLAHVAGRQG